jgi:hypothetical protein
VHAGAFEKGRAEVIGFSTGHFCQAIVK